MAVHWKQLGEAYWSNQVDDPKAFESSKAAFVSCLERDPRRGDCLCWLGIVQRSQGDHAAALESFTRAVEHGAACEYEMARQLGELGELERASSCGHSSLESPRRQGISIGFTCCRKWS
jgi:tetratricopeptide (TPR) repeat protein